MNRTLRKFGIFLIVVLVIAALIGGMFLLLFHLEDKHDASGEYTFSDSPYKGIYDATVYRSISVPDDTLYDAFMEEYNKVEDGDYGCFVGYFGTGGGDIRGYSMNLKILGTNRKLSPSINLYWFPTIKEMDDFCSDYYYPETYELALVKIEGIVSVGDRSYPASGAGDRFIAMKNPKITIVGRLRVPVELL